VERIGPYAVVGRIAKGSTADVLLARSPKNPHEHVVVKRLWPHLASEEQFVRMFVDETRLQSVIVHPTIVRALDLGEDGETYYSVLELVDGPSLSAAVRGPPRGAAGGSIAIGARGARAGVARHAARDPASGDALALVHRDVAPPNILLSRTGDVKLTDFGVVKSDVGRERGLLSTERTQPGIVKGRVRYMSPEQVKGDAIDARSDLFALGVTLWELLRGERLYGVADPHVADAIVHTAAPRLEGPPAVIVELVDALLAKQPSHRPRDARVVAEVLESVAGLTNDAIARYVIALGLPSLARPKEGRA